MKTVKVAILGLGTVGSGVYKLIQKRADVMEKTIGAQMEVKKILVRNMNKKREGVDASLLTDNWNDIIEDEEIQIVIEVMGGIEPAKTMILEALRAGKNVVSANKDLIAEEGHVLLATAEENHVDFLFEAAVAGAIPIIRPMKQCLAVNDISEVVGIVNGTTNYILTKMTEEGMDFSDALEKAQELGFAEADPTSDVEGLDAGRKVAIMASIAFHSRVVFPNVFTEGITKITPEDMEYAEELGMTIKLLGTSRKIGDDSFYAMVAPFLVGQTSPLYSVNDVFNAVFVHGNVLGDAMFYGSGAGKLPTGSAVAGDIFEVARDIMAGSTGRINCTCYKELRLKRPQLLWRLSADPYGTVCRFLQICNAPEQCGLSTTGLSNNTNCFSLGNFKAYTINSFNSSNICKEISMNIVKLNYVFRILHGSDIL